IEEFALILEDAGIQRMAARVFAALEIYDDAPLTASDLTQRLQVSAAAISRAILPLLQFGLIIKTRPPGARLDRSAVAPIPLSLLVKRDRILTRMRDVMAAGLQIVDKGSPAEARLDEACDFVDFIMEDLSGTLERWEAHRRRAR